MGNIVGAANIGDVKRKKKENAFLSREGGDFRRKYNQP